MTDAQRSAAAAMYSALSNLPCSCVFSEPYCNRDPAKITKHCARCRSMREWDAANASAVKS